MIDIERHDGWRKLILNRPEKLNAVNAAMLTALLDAISAAEADASTRALLLTGNGRGFCAGQELGPDITPGPNGPPDLEKLAHTYHHEVVRRLRASRLPVVCAVNGVAAGAGASFALACDIVLAAKSARFVQAFVKIGLVPDSGATFFLTRSIGEARARALAMLGDAVDAETAMSWGMIWQVVDDAALMTRAETMTATLAKAPTGALGRMKQLFVAAGTNTLTAQLDLEARLQGESGRTGDYAEGVRAFSGKASASVRPMNDFDSLARRCADAMWKDDAASRGLGMTLDLVAAGRARMSMIVRSDMVNGHGLCHGGFIFALADSAMAFASNSHGERAVAQHNSITYVRSGRLGETLTAEAEERSRSGRSGIYDVRVTGSSDGAVVAEFRGHSRLSGGRFFTEGA